MATKIFLSHASSETEQATRVAGLLREAGIEPVLDANVIKGGDSFITFMDNGLTDCDYCLLLWSRAASDGRWVKVEWQSALHRSVISHQSFLVIGRLEELDPPPVLRPRSWIELFPALEPGINQLVAMWRDDVAAANASKRPVCPPQRQHPANDFGQAVYISSKVFGKTFPFNVDFDAPATVVTDSIVDYLDAPRQIDHKGIIGARFEYSLSNGRETLDPVQSLNAQHIAEKSLLWLQVEITPFAAGKTVGPAPAPATFRGESNELEPSAKAELLAWSQKVGLGY